jgi:hypothetical protein
MKNYDGGKTLEKKDDLEDEGDGRITLRRILRK